MCAGRNTVPCGSCREIAIFADYRTAFDYRVAVLKCDVTSRDVAADCPGDRGCQGHILSGCRTGCGNRRQGQRQLFRLHRDGHIIFCDRMIFSRIASAGFERHFVTGFSAVGNSGDGVPVFPCERAF